MKNVKRLLTVLLSLVIATCIVGLCACQKTDAADQSQKASSLNSVISVPTENSQSANASASQGASHNDSSDAHSAGTSTDSASDPSSQSSIDSASQGGGQSDSSGDQAPAEKVDVSFVADASKLHTEAQFAYLADNYSSVATYADGAHEKSKPLPAVITWQASKTLTDCELVLSEDENFGAYKTIAVEGNEISVGNLKVGTTYYYKLIGKHDGKSVTSEVQSFTTDSALPRFIDCDGVTNMRDLGGYAVADGTIRQGFVYRSGRLNKSDTNTVSANITEKGIAALRDLGIKTEIDLRETKYWDVSKKMNEVGGLTDTSVIGEDINYYQCPIDVLAGVTDSSNYASVRMVFARLADKNNYPVLYHCTIGTDRTGYISYLLNGLLGVDKDTLLRDYLFSNFGKIDSTRSVSSIENLYVNMLDGQEGDTLSEKIENYLVNTIGVTEHNIKLIKTILIKGYSEPETGDPDIPDDPVERYLPVENALSLYDGAELSEFKNKLKIEAYGITAAFVLEGYEADQGEDFMISVNIDEISAENVGFVIGTLGETNANNVMFDWRNQGSKKDIYIWRASSYGWKGVEDMDLTCAAERQATTFDFVHKNGKYYMFIGGVKVLEIGETTNFSWSSATIKDIIGTEGKIKVGLTTSFGSTVLSDFSFTKDADAISELVPDEIAEDFKPVENAIKLYEGEMLAFENKLKINASGITAAFVLEGYEADQGEDFMISVNIDEISAENVGFVIGTLGETNANNVMFDWRNQGSKKDIYIWRASSYGWKGVEDMDLTCAAERQATTFDFVHKNGKYYMFIGGVKVLEIGETTNFSWSSATIKDIIGTEGKIKVGLTTSFGSTIFSDFSFTKDADAISALVPDPVNVFGENENIYSNGSVSGNTLSVDTNKPTAVMFDGVEFAQNSDYVVSVNVSDVTADNVGFVAGTLEGPTAPGNRYHVMFQWRRDNKIYICREGGDGWGWSGEGLIDISDKALTYGAATLSFVYKGGTYYMFINGVKVMESTGSVTPSWGGSWSFLGCLLGDQATPDATVKFGGMVFNGAATFTDLVYSTDAAAISEFVPD